MNQNDQPSDNAIAMAGVGLFGNHAQGQAPDWFELSQWKASEDNNARSAEILSHIANDPDCFQRWLDLAAAEAYAAQEMDAGSITNAVSNTAFQTTNAPQSDASSPGADTPHRTAVPIVNWLKTLFQLPAPVYAGGFAALMLAVLITPLMRDSQTPSMQELADRRTDAYIAAGGQLAASPPIIRRTKNLGALFDTLSRTDVDLMSFQYGVYRTWEQLNAVPDETSAQWSEWSSDLPQKPVDCKQALDRAACESAADDLTALGQWAFLTQTACKSSADDLSALSGDFWTAQADALDQLLTSDAVQRSEQFGTVTAVPASRDVEDLCQQANLLLTAGF